MSSENMSGLFLSEIQMPGGRLFSQPSFPSRLQLWRLSPCFFSTQVSEDIFAILSVLDGILDFWILLTTLQFHLKCLRLCWGVHIFFQKSW